MTAAYKLCTVEMHCDGIGVRRLELSDGSFVDALGAVVDDLEKTMHRTGRRIFAKIAMG
jgi:hypothetical protein